MYWLNAANLSKVPSESKQSWFDTWNIDGVLIQLGFSKAKLKKHLTISNSRATIEVSFQLKQTRKMLGQYST